MSRKKLILVPVFAVAGIVMIIIILWGICVLCSYHQYSPDYTTNSPDYYYSYNMSRNGTIDRVLIIAQYPSSIENDVRYLDSNGDEIEVEIWGNAAPDAVYFRKEGEELTVSIHVSNAIDNFVGMKPAIEYVYLPRNWTYTIISTNDYGNTIVENQSWSYTSYGKT